MLQEHVLNIQTNESLSFRKKCFSHAMHNQYLYNQYIENEDFSLLIMIEKLLGHLLTIP